jgi:ABC-type transport system involved in cytochrome bd biosynthesis fused ATPase/permease subunit
MKNVPCSTTWHDLDAIQSAASLDEPTAALDARAERQLFERVRDLFHGRSVLLISHRFASVRSADHIYVLRAGQIAEHGNHQELMATGGLYTELFELQAAAFLDQVKTDGQVPVPDDRASPQMPGLTV